MQSDEGCWGEEKAREEAILLPCHYLLSGIKQEMYTLLAVRFN